MRGVAGVIPGARVRLPIAPADIRRRRLSLPPETAREAVRAAERRINTQSTIAVSKRKSDLDFLTRNCPAQRPVLGFRPAIHGKAEIEKARAWTFR